MEKFEISAPSRFGAGNLFYWTSLIFFAITLRIYNSLKPPNVSFSRIIIPRARFFFSRLIQIERSILFIILNKQLHVFAKSPYSNERVI